MEDLEMVGSYSFAPSNTSVKVDGNDVIVMLPNYLIKIDLEEGNWEAFDYEG